MGALNPLLTSLLLRDSLQGRDRSGLFTATATGPVRYRAEEGLAGYWVEGGTTNLVTNPVAGTNTTGWDAVSNVTLARVTSLPGPLPSYLSGITTGFRVTADNPVSATNPIASCPLTLTTAAHAHGWYVWVPSAFSATGLRISDANFASATGRAAIAVDLSKRDQWQWVPDGCMNPVAGDLNGHIQLQVTAGTMGAGEQVWFAAVQCEAKSYSTSPAVGSLGPGYSWASTAHASASVRANAVITIPVDADNRIDSVQGAMAARYLRLQSATTVHQAIVHHGNFIGDNDSVGIENHNSGFVRGLSRRAGVNVFAPAAAWPSLLTWHNAWVDWDSDTISAALDGGTRVSVATGAPTGTPSTPFIYVGSVGGSAGFLNGLLSDLLIYDAPLSDARRAIVLDALDNEATEDELWALFAGNPYRNFQLRPY